MVSQEAIDEIKALYEERNKITAKEMFEEANYKLSFEDEDFITYSYIPNDEYIISFDKENKNICFEIEETYNVRLFDITPNVLKAINKQIEELGWDNE